MGDRSDFQAIFLVFFLIFLMPFAFAVVDSSPDPQTLLNIPNVAPTFSGPIQNFTWAFNENLTDAFNLYDYFDDANGDNLTFTYNPDISSNISVVINQSTGSVSFYPSVNFSGYHNITFTANDSFLTAVSNVVFLGVGIDDEAPKWSNLARSISQVDQNDVVSFTADWTDNEQLDSFMFSAEQFGFWINYSVVPFSGTANTSNYSIVIATPPAGTVRWRFYAWDTSGNVNVTDISEFDVFFEQPTSSGGGGGGGSSSSRTIRRSVRSVLSSIGINLRLDYDLRVTPESIDVELLQGSSQTAFLTLDNIGLKNLDLKFEIFNIQDLVSLSSSGFLLAPSASKDLAVDISASRTYPPGQYFGLISITGSNISESVPVVVTVKHFDPFINFSLFVPDSSSLVNPGENVTVFVNLSQKDYIRNLDTKLYLSVKDTSGFIYDSLEKDLIVGSGYNGVETLNIPRDTAEGRYLVYGRIEYQGRHAVDSASFDVGYFFKLSSLLQYSGFFILILILSFVFVVLILRYERSKKKERLLQLYLLLSRMKDKLNDGDVGTAGEIYVRIKHVYGEPVPKELLQDKEFLRKELKRFGDALKNSELGKVVSEEATSDSKDSSSETSPKKEGTDGNVKESSAPKKDSSPSVPQSSSKPAAVAAKPASVSPQSQKKVVSSSSPQAKPTPSTPVKSTSSVPQKKVVSSSNLSKPVVSSKPSISPSTGGSPKKVVKKIIRRVVKKKSLLNDKPSEVTKSDGTKKES